MFLRSAVIINWHDEANGCKHSCITCCKLRAFGNAGRASTADLELSLVTSAACMSNISSTINLLKRSGFFMYHQVCHSEIVHGARFAMSVLYGSQRRQQPLLYTWSVQKVSDLNFSRLNKSSAGSVHHCRCGGDISAHAWIFSRL
jgi:hypothetical protein